MIMMGSCESYDNPFKQSTASSGSRRQGESTIESGYRPLAYVEGDPVYVKEMLPLLLESAGGSILSELILDRLIIKRLHERNLELVGAHLDAEKSLMLETLSDDEDEAALMLLKLRQRRGLGEKRFNALLRRNAGLRLLVQDKVQITQEDLRRGFELEFGPRFQPRIIVTERISDAQALQERIFAGESFADLATKHSTDISSFRGGLLSPISPSDPTYPKTIRDVLVDMQSGEVSEILIVDKGYALLKLERIIDTTPPDFDQVRNEVEIRVKLAREKLLMQQLARELIAEIKLITLDPSLNQSWQLQRSKLLSD